MALKNFQKVVKELAHAKSKAVILSGGGEPTVYPYLIEAIETITQAGMESALITNLLVRKDRLYKTILEKCSWCRISLDASNESLYRKIRGTVGFEKVVSNIRHLAAMKRKLNSSMTIGVQSVANRHNMHDILKEIKMASKLGVDYMQVRPVETMPGSRLIYTKRDFDRIMREIEGGRQFERSDFKIIRSNKWDVINPYLKDRHHGFSFCHAYMMFAAIDVRGDVYVCCHQIENRNKKMCYGNILKEPFSRIMARRKAVIRNLDLKQCYLECRGSNINRRLESLKHQVPHANFL